MEFLKLSWLLLESRISRLISTNRWLLKISETSKRFQKSLKLSSFLQLELLPQFKAIIWSNKPFSFNFLEERLTTSKTLLIWEETSTSFLLEIHPQLSLKCWDKQWVLPILQLRRLEEDLQVLVWQQQSPLIRIQEKSILMQVQWCLLTKAWYVSTSLIRWMKETELLFTKSWNNRL